MSKILVTGSNGLIGSAIRSIASNCEDDFYFVTRKDADLTSRDEVHLLFDRIQPDLVIHAAAKVGGLGANLSQPADIFYQNIIMNSHMIHYAMLFGVKKMLCFSSLCTFPHDAKILREDLQQVGEPYIGNYAYGYAKRMVDIQIRAYKEQYKTEYCSMILTNTYGPYDNWNLDDGHVVPSLIHKCHLAKQEGKPLVLWGDGSTLREFIYAGDVARCAMDIIKSNNIVDKVIISSQEELTIKKLCEYVCSALEFDGEILYDRTKSNGQHKRPSDNTVLRNLVPDFKFTSTKDGVKIAADWFVDHYPNVRK